MPNLAYWDPNRNIAARKWYPPVGVQPVAAPLAPAVGLVAPASPAGALMVAPSPDPCRCGGSSAPAIAAPIQAPSSAALALNAAAPVVVAEAPAWWVKREWWVVAAVIAAFLVLGSKQ